LGVDFSCLFSQKRKKKNSLDDLGFRVDWTLLQKEKGRKRKKVP
jgi:hypothetical protein